MWELKVGGLLRKEGYKRLNVEKIKVKKEESKKMEKRKRKKIREMDIDVGNIKVRMEGEGKMDYVIEIVVNVLNKILRYKIVNDVEGNIK